MGRNNNVANGSKVAAHGIIIVWLYSVTCVSRRWRQEIVAALFEESGMEKMKG